MSGQIKSAYQLIIGLDRSDQKADLHYLDPTTGREWTRSIGTSPEALDAWLRRLREEHPETQIGLIVEQPAATILAFLHDRPGLSVHAINPITLQKFREAFVVSRAKDDAKDACYLAHLSPIMPSACRAGSPRRRPPPCWLKWCKTAASSWTNARPWSTV